MKTDVNDAFDALKKELTVLVLELAAFAVKEERRKWLILLGTPLFISISLNVAFIAGFIK